MIKRILAILSVMACVVQGARVEYNWNITYATANPDGVYERRVIGVNGQWPQVLSFKNKVIGRSS